MIGAMTLILFTMTNATCNATVDSINADDTYNVGPSGCVRGE